MCALWPLREPSETSVTHASQLRPFCLASFQKAIINDSVNESFRRLNCLFISVIRRDIDIDTIFVHNLSQMGAVMETHSRQTPKIRSFMQHIISRQT